MRDNLLKYLDSIHWTHNKMLEGLIFRDITIRPHAAQKYARKLLRELA